jgi:hypothetical protein
MPQGSGNTLSDRVGKGEKKAEDTLKPYCIMPNRPNTPYLCGLHKSAPFGAL